MPVTFRARQQGFTLVEISIVIVVIGLLAGGIIYGSSMIRSAQVSKVISEVASYKMAVMQFRDKYTSLPGDFPKAVAHWGEDASCPNTTGNTVNKVVTCNGNGDGRISVRDHATDGTSAVYEANRAWQHLANAGMISGSYSGTLDNGGGYVADKTNPKTPISGTVLALFYFNNNTGMDPNHYPIAYTHLIALYGTQPFSTDSEGPSLTAQEARMLDSKIDDSMPGLGIVRSRPAAFTPDCTSGNNAATSTYLSANDNEVAVCYLYFLQDFK